MTGSIRVLHVDDDEAFVETAAALLEREDERLTVDVATTAAGGLDQLSNRDYDCVVSDYEMPGMDGLEFLESVRARHSDMPFILFTGNGSESVASEAICAGVTDYLQKSSGSDHYALLSNRIRNAVAAQHQAAEVSQQRHRLEQILTTVPSCVVQLNRDGEFIYANDQAKEILGLTEREVTQRAYNDPEWEITDLDGEPIPDDDLPFQQVLDTGEPVDGIRHKISWPGGSERVLEVSGAPIFDDGRVTSVVFSLSDITDRTEREQQLEDLHEATRDLYEAESVQAVATIASRAAATILGFNMNGVHLYDEDAGGLAPTAVSKTTKRFADKLVTFDEGIAWEAYRDGEVRSYGDIREADELYDPETDMRSGLYFPLGEHGILLAASPEIDAFDDSDLTLGRILAANATSAFDRVEQDALLRERTATLTRQNRQLDEFASVVAHDLRNPLQVADGKINLANETQDLSQLEDALQALDRMETLIQDLLRFAKEGDTVTEMSTVSLDSVATQAWRNVEAPAASLDVESTFEFQADASRLQQVFENLFANSVTHGGDEVAVTAGSLDDQTGFYISDNGTGIPASDRDRIFESGYSTSSGETGFGLAIVREIIEAHGWEISATESADGGARFEITGIDSA